MVRGIVICPGVHFIGQLGEFQVGSRDVVPILKHCALYWDRIEWPNTNSVTFEHGPDVDALIDEGVLTRSLVEVSGNDSGHTRFNFVGGDGPIHDVILEVSEGPLIRAMGLVAQAQIEMFEQLEGFEPGVWSLAQGGDRLKFPLQNLPERRILEAQLYHLLPTPIDSVPFQDILDFRRTYRSELETLRTYLDDIYAEIIDSTDQGRVRSIATLRLAKSIEDLEAAFKGRRIPAHRSSVKVSINIPKVLKDAAAGAYIASLAGVSISVGAGVAAAIGSINLDYPVIPEILPARIGPLAYLYRAKAALA